MKKKAVPMQHEDVTGVLKAIGEKIRTHRKTITNNYETYAKNQNLNKVTLFRLEKGEDCNVSTLITVLRSMNLTLEDFFKGIN